MTQALNVLPPRPITTSYTNATSPTPCAIGTTLTVPTHLLSSSVWLTVSGSTDDLLTDDCGYPPTYVSKDRAYVPQDGRPLKLKLGDGTIIDIAPNGSFKVIDKDAKITYKANRVREFNSYINASHRLEEFIEFCGKHGVRQGEMLNLPLKLFVGWLVLQAAEADNEVKPDDMKVLADLRQHKLIRCGSCGRFMAHKMVKHKITFCKPKCFELAYHKQLAA